MENIHASEVIKLQSDKTFLKMCCGKGVLIDATRYNDTGRGGGKVELTKLGQVSLLRTTPSAL